ncbi:putative meiotically up-regulated gene protein [Xylogone sp. PMI_703]|nr:putative meiotically up-regulated gene protein [Xylogone sp. PMI_703]
MNGSGGDIKQGNGHAVAPNNASAPEPTTPGADNNNINLEDLTNQALRFLSTASPRTLGGIAVGLAAVTYVVLGRVGLVLMGAFGGVIIHASWENRNSDKPDAGRREKPVDVITRVLEWRDVQQRAQELADSPEFANEAMALEFETFRPETSKALNEFVDAVVRDYIKGWYHPILPMEQSFPEATRMTLKRCFTSISQHLGRKRPADTFLDFLTNASSIVIVFLNELSSALSASQGSGLSPAESVRAYLSTNPESNLANIMNERQQARKFKMVAEDIMQNFLEKSAYACEPARTLLREIFAGVVLEMALKTCSQPEWINGFIVYFLEEEETDNDQGLSANNRSSSNLSDLDGFIDGNVGNIELAKVSKSQAEKQEKQEVKRHKKRLSKAEEAMEEAMEEAKRLSRLIAEEEAEKAAAAASSPPTDDVTSAQDIQKQDDEGPKVTDVPLTNSIPASSTVPERTRPARSNSHAPFTSFDQIVPQTVPTALQNDPQAPQKKSAQLTLHNATITILDDSSIADKGRLRSKPNWDYLLQIEPESSQYPGWMIIRKYPDFEVLHEILRRIATVSGVTAFTEQHSALPNWKDHTKGSLRGELERYIRDACWHQKLAECEGMKRFLEKDQGQNQSFSAAMKSGFPNLGWSAPSAFESMGKGVLDVLTSAPKGAAEGGKAVFGGVTGVFNNLGNLGQKKSNGSANGNTHPAGRASISTLPRMDSFTSISSSRRGRQSEDSLRASPVVHTQPSKFPPMERRPSYNSIAEDEVESQGRPSLSAASSVSGRESTSHSRDPSRAPSRGTPISSPTQSNVEDHRLSLAPSDIPDDYGSCYEYSPATQTRFESAIPSAPISTSNTQPVQSPNRSSISSPKRLSTSIPPTPPRRRRAEPGPVTEQETRVAVELVFAVINELYTLSSAWNIRRTLLNAAKTFLLRPGNPSLSAIQSLIQDSIIAANTTDTAVANHLHKLRKNTLPTEEERKEWPENMSDEEKEKLRIKARKILVERGVPAALIGVMGQAATTEALGRMFDCIQVEEVARGLIFGLLLQGIRAVMH